jgi:predicted extracellular nuclease
MRSPLSLLLLTGCVLAGCGRQVNNPMADAPIQVGVCGAPAQLISEVQGAALRSPQETANVTVEAVVIAEYTSGLGGVFLQEEQQDRDGDPMTSEGLYVQIDGARPKVVRGDVVRASGQIAEVGDEPSTLTTLIELSELRVCGHLDELPQPALVEEAPLVADDWEAHEGMRVAIEPTVTVIGNYNLLARGELLVGLNGRQWVPTELHPPGALARGVEEDNLRARLLIDDGSMTATAPERIGYLATQPSADTPYRVGTQLTGLVGVLDERNGSYRLHLSDRIAVTQAPRPESTPVVAGTLRVATFNVLNFFNGDGNGGGFPTERGASDVEELTRQRAKILSALKAMDADLYTLLEVENDGYEKGSAIEELTSRLNQARGRRNEYDYVRAPTARLGSDVISVGLLYRPKRLKLVGPAATLEGPVFLELSRQPLAQTFEDAKTGGRFTVVANHWKSKGGCTDADASNQDRGDGQGCWNGARVETARALADWLGGDPTASGDSDLLLLGDFNSHSQEDPIRLLGEAGFVQLGNTETEAHYSFVYEGLSGSLDHALASVSLAAQVEGAAVWHINADEMPQFDFNREDKSKALEARMFRSDPFRSSDHDPMIVGFDLLPPAPVVEPEPVTPPAPATAKGK